jgi:signal transduction histidine kinase
MDGQAGTPLRFPDGPKLELDQLIDQLVERAREVQRSQGRLRSLLRANEMVTAGISLHEVLKHIVQAACTLAGARYGALGVIAHDGTLEQFIHVGMDEDLVPKIGHLPEGKGLLGALINDPQPIRLNRIADDPRSSGFPTMHPPMASFLGVPIRIRGEVFGNLYLTESATGQFSAEDEELVRSLAVTAGTAISNARLYSESQLQQRWLGASAEISAQLLASAGEDPLKMIARRASEIAEADLVTVALLAAEGADVMIEVAIGQDADALLGRRFPVSETLAGQAIAERAPLLVRSSAESSGDRSDLESVFELGPVMVIPLVGTSSVLGALTIARRAERPSFSDSDLNMATGFANHASIAIELTAARADQQRVVLLEDRDRIARDLHDHVIQQLFAIGLSLEGTASALGDNEQVVSRLRERVGDIDRTIRQIRTSIFELRGPLGAGSAGLRTRVLEIAEAMTGVLGFAPGVAFGGPIDLAVTGALADDVAACVREGLTNVAKHAQASSAGVDLDVAENEVTVLVWDNGVGVDDGGRSSGVANLRARAEQRHGSFELSVRPQGGTQMVWKALI